MKIIDKSFFRRDACRVAVDLLGKIICVDRGRISLRVRIVETESYYKAEKASHASLGYTEKRRALFMEAGTIYMYHARGKPSLNFSAEGDGNAVLIKSCAVMEDDAAALNIMLNNNRKADGSLRDVKKLCSGQTLVCLSLGINVVDLDQKSMSKETLYIGDDGYSPETVIQTERLGIPDGRDGHLPYRFVDGAYADRCTNNPLRSRNTKYRLIKPDENIQKD